MPTVNLNKQCGSCGSWKWCGRPCAMAPKTGGVVHPLPDFMKEDIPEKTELPKYPDFSDPDFTAKTLAEKPKAKKVKTAKIPQIRLSEGRKVSIHIRLSPEIVEFFEKDGKGWQTRLNDFLLAQIRKEK